MKFFSWAFFIQELMDNGRKKKENRRKPKYQQKRHEDDGSEAWENDISIYDKLKSILTVF